jgi:hypothetical protein
MFPARQWFRNFSGGQVRRKHLTPRRVNYDALWMRML